MSNHPSFPPLLKGHQFSADANLLDQAQAMMKQNELGAGDILWSDHHDNLSILLVLEPEVARARCGEMLHLLMVAFGDAAGALSEPEIAITYRWPSQILLNDAGVGGADLHLAPCSDDENPQWMFAKLNIAIRPELAELNPGENMDRTTMWDEGCGNIPTTELIESVARHIVSWIHAWEEEGFKPIHTQWTGRMNEAKNMMDGFDDLNCIGLDENGNALIKSESGTTTMQTLVALEILRSQTGTK